MEPSDTGSFRPPYTGPNGPWFQFLENTETVTPPATAGLKQALLVDSAGAITLPPAGTAEHGYYVKNISTGTVTVETTETIDGNTSYSLDAQYEAIHVISDGSNWYILSIYP